MILPDERASLYSPLTDMFALVERFRYFPGQHRVDGAHDDQYYRIGESYHVTRVYVAVAD